nr:carboxypeptidase regulatory-like domain-containing protein [Gemmatimonadota bacterium]
MKRVLLSYLFCLLGSVLLPGCDDDGPSGPDRPPNPVIASVSPLRVEVGDTITITGTNFGSNAQDVAVTVNGTSAGVVSVTPTTILAVIPSSVQSGSGTVRVTVERAAAAASASLTILTSAPPVIGGFDPDTVAAGGTLTITGQNFGDAIGETSVSIAGTSVQILSVATGQILVQVLAAASGTVAVVVTVRGRASAPQSVTVAPTEPPDSTGTVLGRVTESASGAGIGGAVIVADAIADTIPVVSVTTDAGGDYRIENIPAGTFVVTATAEGFNSGSTTVTVAAGQSVTADFSLDVEPTTGSILGRVTNAATGSGLDNAEVTVNVLGDTVPIFTANANSLGNYRLDGIPPGTFTVTATSPGFTALSSEVTVIAGQIIVLNLALTPLSGSLRSGDEILVLAPAWLTGQQQRRWGAESPRWQDRSGIAPDGGIARGSGRGRVSVFYAASTEPTWGGDSQTGGGIPHMEVG